MFYIAAGLSLTSFVFAFGFLLMLFNDRMNKPLMIIGLSVCLALAYIFNQAGNKFKVKRRSPLRKLPRKQ